MLLSALILSALMADTKTNLHLNLTFILIVLAIIALLIFIWYMLSGRRRGRRP